MPSLTRRNLLALAGGGAGVAACQATPSVAAPFAGTITFDHGVASGDPRSDRVILWTRVTPIEGSSAGPVNVVWQVFSDAAMAVQVQAGAVQTSSSRDYTVKVDATGLAPAQTYYFAFSVYTSGGLVASPRGRTRTLAASGTRPVTAAVVSCSNYPFGLFNVYDAIAQIDDLDLIIHLGDYFYEYGPEGYGGPEGEVLGREHLPAREIVTLADYRERHGQYKSDKALQRAHATAPWICTWDDHESANNSYRTGAQNHAPTDEGKWTDRKQRAVQAYLEWMPVRDPSPGSVQTALWRSFELGDLATLICLETRLTGRSEELSWTAALAGVAPEHVAQTVRQTLTLAGDEARTMLGFEQEDWLAGELKRSVGAGKRWQCLANQTIMARTKSPNLAAALSTEQIDQAAQRAGDNADRLRALVGFTRLGVPSNLDAWDGFPAARERLYQAAASAQASLVTLTGDTHTGWANHLVDGAGAMRGVEFGSTSVTSPGVGSFLQGIDGLAQMYVDANPDEVAWFDPDGHGFTLLILSEAAVQARFQKVSTITQASYTVSEVAAFETRAGERGRLRRLE